MGGFERFVRLQHLPHTLERRQCFAAVFLPTDRVTSAPVADFIPRAGKSVFFFGEHRIAQNFGNRTHGMGHFIHGAGGALQAVQNFLPLGIVLRAGHHVVGQTFRLLQNRARRNKEQPAAGKRLGEQINFIRIVAGQQKCRRKRSEKHKRSETALAVEKHRGQKSRRAVSARRKSHIFVCQENRRGGDACNRAAGLFVKPRRQKHRVNKQHPRKRDAVNRNIRERNEQQIGCENRRGQSAHGNTGADGKAFSGIHRRRKEIGGDKRRCGFGKIKKKALQAHPVRCQERHAG